MTRSRRTAPDDPGTSSPVIALLLALWTLVAVPLSIAMSIVYYSDAPWLWVVLGLLYSGVVLVLFALFVVLNALEGHRAATPIDPFDRRHPPVR